jgi:predicted secreted Zn-dependent protease
MRLGVPRAEERKARIEPCGARAYDKGMVSMRRPTRCAIMRA